MSIYCVTCDCGSSEQLVRQCLHKYGYPKWGTEVIHKGKNKSLAKVEDLIRQNQNSIELSALFSHIKNSSKWVVIIGVGDDKIRWTDIAKHDMKSDIEAEAIISHFA